jgi:hypothetical protein
MSRMVSSAQDALSDVNPIRVTLGKILYHPEAVMLEIQPINALSRVLQAAEVATRKVIGRDGVINDAQTGFLM